MHILNVPDNVVEGKWHKWGRKWRKLQITSEMERLRCKTKQVCSKRI